MPAGLFNALFPILQLWEVICKPHLRYQTIKIKNSHPYGSAFSSRLNSAGQSNPEICELEIRSLIRENLSSLICHGFKVDTPLTFTHEILIPILAYFSPRCTAAACWMRLVTCLVRTNLFDNLHRSLTPSKPIGKPLWKWKTQFPSRPSDTSNNQFSFNAVEIPFKSRSVCVENNLARIIWRIRMSDSKVLKKHILFYKIFSMSKTEAIKRCWCCSTQLYWTIQQHHGDKLRFPFLFSVESRRKGQP